MSNKGFRVNKPIADTNKAVEAKAEVFGSAANSTNKLDPNAEPTKSFTVPLNEYELELLRLVADKEDRSMRKVGRRLLADALKAKAD